MQPKIYDCFCYFNEDMLLKVRLETLWEKVDHFVIVESVYNSAGKPKPLNFKPEKFQQYASKIRYLVVSDYPHDINDAWQNELYQRNFFMNGLIDASPEDWILISDLDEIPHPEKIQLFNPERYKRADFQQAAYSYYLNNRCYQKGQPVLWHGSKITTYDYLVNFFGSPERMKSYKSSGTLRSLKRYLFKKWMVQTIREGGWHFTWIASIENIILKLESFAHQEFNKPEYKDPEMIKQKIASGHEIINPLGRCIPQIVDSQFPDYIVQHQDELSTWLIPVK